MPGTIYGPRKWALTVDDDGYREYTLTLLVVVTSTLDGPGVALYDTPGMPLPGSPWAVDNDLDLWVWCRPGVTVRPHQEKEGEPNKHWQVELKFSNKPSQGRGREGSSRCFDLKIEDPLLEPYELSGDVRERMVEATSDRFGKPLLMSSHEPIRGAQVEFEENIHTIEVGWNVINLQLALLASFKDCVNDRTLWGMPPRTIKFASYRWQRKYYGLCYKYYHRTLSFAVNERGWDRDVMDEGSKALNGAWGNASLGQSEDRWYLDNIISDTGIPSAPNKLNPTHFVEIHDKKGNPTRVPLDGNGVPFYREITDDCSQCVTAPQIWKATIGNKSYELAHQVGEGVGCTWRVTDPYDATTTVTLTYIDNDPGIAPYWRITRITLPNSLEQWDIYATEFQCNFTNLFTRHFPAIGQDKSNLYATLAPIGPGRIHIEKYHPANLLLLGIPPILELA